MCGAKDLGEALRWIRRGFHDVPDEGEPGTGDIVQAVRHMRHINQQIGRWGAERG